MSARTVPFRQPLIAQLLPLPNEALVREIDVRLAVNRAGPRGQECRLPPPEVIHHTRHDRARLVADGATQRPQFAELAGSRRSRLPVPRAVSRLKIVAAMFSGIRQQSVSVTVERVVEPADRRVVAQIDAPRAIRIGRRATDSTCA